MDCIKIHFGDGKMSKNPIRKVWKPKDGSKMVTIPDEIPIEPSDLINFKIEDENGRIYLEKVEI
ncbi:MAG: hypothetical protein R6U44_01540 [Archaeoglobaceae archaeon]